MESDQAVAHERVPELGRSVQVWSQAGPGRPSLQPVHCGRRARVQVDWAVPALRHRLGVKKREQQKRLDWNLKLAAQRKQTQLQFIWMFQPGDIALDFRSILVSECRSDE